MLNNTRGKHSAKSKCRMFTRPVDLVSPKHKGHEGKKNKVIKLDQNLDERDLTKCYGILDWILGQKKKILMGKKPDEI